MLSLAVSFLLVANAAGMQLPLPAPGSRVSGRVVDAASGDPLPGTRVTLVAAPTSRPAAPPAPPVRPLTSETNADGQFMIADVPPGRWRVVTQKTGYVALAPTEQSSFVEVAAAAVYLDIRLDRGGAVSGRLLDERGKVLSDVIVQAGQRTRAPDGTMRLTTGNGVGRTSDLGEYRLAGLPAGDYIIMARPRPNPIGPLGTVAAHSPTTFVATYYPGVADLAAAVPISVVAGGATAAIDFTLLSAPAYQVSGVVIDQNGRPVAGAAVQLTQRGSAFPGTSASATTQSDGTFRAVNVPGGTYTALAAIPTVIRNGSSTSTSVTFGGPQTPGSQEVVVQGDITGLRLTVRRP